MAQTYTVNQGDHISGIAQQFGFARFETIWDHPNNAALKARRDNGHVLYPGDQVYIPDPQPKSEDIATTKVHKFRLMSKPLKIRIAVLDFDNKPIANAACVLEVAGSSQNLKTDGKGLVEMNIPKTAKTGTLKVPDYEMNIPFNVGYLDPVDEDTGWQARLLHLGYYKGEIGDAADRQQLTYAVEEFQRDNKLTVDGDAGPATQSKLKALHGA